MPPSPKLALAMLLALGACCAWWMTRPTSPPVAPPLDEVLGAVRDSRDPVSGARVRLKGTAISAITAADGRFRLPRGNTDRVTAWKDGYLIAGSLLSNAPLDLRLVPLPEEDHDDYDWVDPSPDAAKSGNCANCHAETYREWAASGHSRSASGRRFRNLYEGTNWNGEDGVGWGLLKDYPDGAGVCASCHAPAIPDDDRASRDDLRHLSGVATHGVHCDYCHKIADVGAGTAGLTHGRFNLRLKRPASATAEQLFFGPLDDVDRGEDAFSPLYHESRYCASCHEGVVFGVHVYSTYSEWLTSPARREGKQCQMTPTGTMANIAPGRGGIERDPKTLANHRFFAPDRDDMLRRSVRLDVEARHTAGGVRAVARIGAENVGHRVPTGFIDRHLILTIDALDAGGKRVAVQTGPKLPEATGPQMTGQPGRLFAKLLPGRDGKAPAPFWLAGGEPEDNRLRPDRVEEIVWQFPSETAQLRVRVLYRRFWDTTVRSKGWPDRDRVIHDRSVLPR
jgi:hypothetical protein